MSKPVEKIRLQKFLSQAGIASRRHGEQMITRGEVRVNGQVVTELGTRVDPARDRVTVSGRQVAVERHVYFMLNKPRGVVTTRSDPEGRQTVIDIVKSDERIYPIGRLDYNTEGVLLLTNDGDLANGLMHPRKEVKKTYHVKVRGMFSPAELTSLREGVTLDDGVTTEPAEVETITRGTSDRNSWVAITIHEGRNRQIHRMMEALGRDVLRLERVAYAGLTSEELAPGKWRPLLSTEVAKLRRAAGLAAEHRAEQHRPRPSSRPQARPREPKRRR